MLFLKHFEMVGSGSKSRKIGEQALIAAISKRAGSVAREMRVGIGDDCAVVRPAKGEEIVVTTDFSLEGVHFRRDWHTPESVGHRCLARGLSDLAAMGARPVAAFLSLAVPEEFLAVHRRTSWVERFFDGMLALAHRYRVPLAGGDTARAPDLACFDIVLLGAVKQGRALLRSRAKAGDLIYVTGALGGAAAELLRAKRDPRSFARLTKRLPEHPHFYPEPRLAVAAKLAEGRLAHAAIDVSDGLSTDLAHICDESGLSAVVDATAIPVHPLAVEAEHGGWTASAMDLSLHSGEDYELLFTSSPSVKIPRRLAGVEVHRIGRMLKEKSLKPRVIVMDADGSSRLLAALGWEHFR